MIGVRPIHLEVDGGITPQNAEAARAAGANVLVAGSAVFKSSDIPATIAALRG
jgi:ribulose-phosphate 3-epimerase